MICEICGEEYDEKCSCYDFELESDSSGPTLCGKLKRKHKMKRYNWSSTRCVYLGCDGYC